MHKSRESHVCTISQPNIDGFCSNLVYFKAHGATETEIMPKHFGRKPYGRNNGRYYGRKAYGRTLPKLSSINKSRSIVQRSGGPELTRLLEV